MAKVKEEFKEKDAIFLAGQLRGPFDWQKLSLEEFLSEMFVRHELDLPFQEVLSPDYLLWKAQVDQRMGLGEDVPPIDYSGFVHRQYNGIVAYWDPERPWRNRKRKDGTKEKVKRFKHQEIFRNDQFTLDKLKGLEDCYMAPVTYAGKNRRNANARYLYAIGIDLDDVGPMELMGLFKNATKEYVGQHGPVGHPLIPAPNIITNSGHGLHVYYLLAEPVALAGKHVWKIMEHISDTLSGMVFKMNTTRKEKRERLSLLQAFRLPETKTKFGEIVSSWRNLGSHAYSIEELNSYFDKCDRLTKKEMLSIYRYEYCETKYTIDEAKRRWPEWYETRVVRGLWISEEKKWHVNRAVYDWWKDILWNTKEGIVGHRFWCTMCLYIYAIKCDIPIEEADADAEALIEHFESFTRNEADPKKHFTLSDVTAAATAYHINYCRFPVWKIDALTSIRIEKNKNHRKGRNQQEHLLRCRALRDINHNNGTWRNNEGRTRQIQIVAEWRRNNPDCENKSMCARDCGIDRKTVAKWWDASDVSFEISPVDLISMWREQNHNSRDRKQCAKDTLLALPTVMKYWPLDLIDTLDEEVGKLPMIPVSYQEQLSVDRLKNADKKMILVNMTKLFLPDAVSPVPGYTIEDVRQIVLSGKWKDLGWELVY